MILRREPLTSYELSAGGDRPDGRPRSVRTLWVSDLHLGTKGCKAAALADFLDAHPAERVYLVGDVIDGWKLGRGWYWDEAQTRLVQRLMDCVRRGVEVTYVPGNHDEGLRKFGSLVLAGVRVKRQAVHELADGRRALILHGDQFDGVVNSYRWLALLGDSAYSLSLALNDALNALRRRFGRRPWSISAYLKERVKDACSYVSAFEEAVARETERWGVDAVICGHIHKAEMRRVGDVLYANDGDWVESCTGLVEHQDGSLELLRWDAEEKRSARLALAVGGQVVEGPAPAAVPKPVAPAAPEPRRDAAPAA